MKSSLFIPMVAAALSAVTSCNHLEIGAQQAGTVPDGDSVAVEINAEYRLVTYDRPIDETVDSDFMDADVKSAMTKSGLYRDRAAAPTKSGSGGSDTLSRSEQIPFCADIKESTLIYRDGNSEFSRVTDLDPDVNPLLGFHESPVDLKCCAARIEIKDGKACTYNSAGGLLSEQEVRMPDYAPFLSELAKYREESATRTVRCKRDIGWLRSRMAAQCPAKAGAEPAYRIYEKGDRVVLEQYVGDTKSGECTTVRTFLSSDITKNYGYEQLENGSLKFRCTHSFSNSTKTRSTGLPSDELPEENPGRTVTEQLSYMNDGTPMIKVSDREYRVNAIHYNIR